MQLKKGNILNVRWKFEGLAPITAQGIENWHAIYKDSMIDDGGEPRLPPKYEWHEIAQGSKLIVIRARVHRGQIELLNPENGIQVLAPRGEVERKVEVLG